MHTPRKRSPRTDGEATRARILLAAGQLFSRFGFAETTSTAIAQAAEVDLASINYHFGSRDKLYQSVLVEAHRHLVDMDEIQKISAATLSADQRLLAVIDGIVKRAKKPQAWQTRVLARELLAPTSHIKVLLDEAVPAKMLAISRILSEISGIPANDPAIFRCLLSVVTPCLMLIVFGHGFPGPLKHVMRNSRKALVDHLHTFAMAGLVAIGQQHSARAD